LREFSSVAMALRIAEGWGKIPLGWAIAGLGLSEGGDNAGWYAGLFLPQSGELLEVWKLWLS
jgi:hypothetical protein